MEHGLSLRYAFCGVMLLVYGVLIAGTGLVNPASAMESVKDKRFRILLLNAYHKGYLWTDEITRGVEETVRHSLAEVHIEYMDTKRQYTSTYLSLLAPLLAEKHRKHHYDIVIVSDNNAFDFILNQGQSIFKDVPVVFCGVNYFNKDQIKGYSHITGVNEQADLAANFNLIQRLHPTLEKVIVVTDDTSTGKRIQKETHTISANPEWKGRVDMICDVSITELVKTLNQLPEHSVVLFTFFFQGQRRPFF